MSISASEKEEWVGSERDPSDSEGPSDLQEELIRVMNKAVQELELSWNPPEEPAKSKLDSWYFRSSRRQVDTRTSVPFFPDVHDQLVKTWSAPQSARVHSATQAMFSQASALHAMAVLQVFQAKLLQSLEGGTASPEAVNDLRAATDFALMATKRAAQVIGRTMGFMVVHGLFS